MENEKFSVSAILAVQKKVQCLFEASHIIAIQNALGLWKTLVL